MTIVFSLFSNSRQRHRGPQVNGLVPLEFFDLIICLLPSPILLSLKDVRGWEVADLEHLLKFVGVDRHIDSLLLLLLVYEDQLSGAVQDVKRNLEGFWTLTVRRFF